MYLTPNTEDPVLINRQQNLIRNALRQFLPLQVRTVFRIAGVVYNEFIYSYDFPGVEPARLIGEQFFDSSLAEVYSGLGDDYQDVAPDWVWLRSWSTAHPDHRTVDSTAIPPDLTFRTWHTGLEAGG
jgi:hypothetical protein